MYWRASHISWVLFQDPANAQTVQGDLAWTDVSQALIAATAAWQAPKCTDLSFEFGGPTSNFNTVFDSGTCGRNLVIFHEKLCSDPAVVPPSDACLAAGTCSSDYNCWDSTTGDLDLTTNTYDLQTGELLQSTMEFDAAPDPMSGAPAYRFTVNGSPTECSSLTDPTQMNCTAYDVQALATREFGRMLGLGWSTASDSVMNESDSTAGLAGRTLGADDVAGVCAIYPAGADPAWCSSPPDAGSCGTTPRIVAKSSDVGCRCEAAGAGGGTLLAPLLLRRRRSRTGERRRS